MILYQIIHTKWTRKGKLVLNEKYVSGFETEKQMKYWLNGKEAMSDDNESWVVYRINY